MCDSATKAMAIDGHGGLAWCYFFLNLHSEIVLQERMCCIAIVILWLDTRAPLITIDAPELIHIFDFLSDLPQKRQFSFWVSVQSSWFTICEHSSLCSPHNRAHRLEKSET